MLTLGKVLNFSYQKYWRTFEQCILIYLQWIGATCMESFKLLSIPGTSNIQNHILAYQFVVRLDGRRMPHNKVVEFAPALRASTGQPERGFAAGCHLPQR